MTGAITTNSTFDGVDIATRDAILTSTTTTAGAALPKAGGTMTGALTLSAGDVGIANNQAFRSGGQALLARYDPIIEIGSGDSDDYLKFKAGAAERMRIDSSGKVGIGTASPDQALHVHGVGTVLSSDSYFVATIQTDRNDDGSSDDGILQFVNGSAKTVKGEIRWDESENNFKLGHGDNQGHIVIASGGNVGIGTTAPAARLDVQPLNTNVLKLGTDLLRHHRITGNASHTFTMECGSYAQFEVTITANQTNGGTNNWYIRGLWQNSHTTHTWTVFDQFGSLSGSTFSITNSAAGTTNSGRLVIQHNYTSNFGGMTIRVNTTFGSYTYALT
jgi:hypothetical protein